MRAMRRRQWRTTILLVLCLAGLAAGLIGTERREQAALARQNAQAEQQDLRVREVLAAAQTDAPLAELLQPESSGPRAELALIGMTDEAAAQALLTALHTGGLTGRFFVTGAQARLYPAALRSLRLSGAMPGLYLPAPWPEGDEALASLLCTAADAVAEACGAAPAVLLTDTAPDDRLRRMAYACGLEQLLVAAGHVPIGGLTAPAEAEELVRSLPPGGVLCMTLAPGTDAAASLALLSDALAACDPALLARKKCTENGGVLAEVQTRVYTVEKSAAMTFQGFGRDTELDLLLKTLDGLHGKALFFVTEQDLTAQGDAIRRVLAAGHDLGLALPAGAGKEPEKLLYRLLDMQAALQSDYGYAGAFVVRQTTGQPSDALREAVHAGGMTLAGAMTYAVQDAFASLTDARDILAALFPEGSPVLQRGQILFFRMNVLQSDSALASLVRLIAQEKSLYGLNSLAAMLRNTAMTYTYPVAEDDVIPRLRGAIGPGHLTGSALTAIQARYLGTDWVTTAGLLPGFTGAEIRTLDKKGLVPNDDRAVFLTFDDWGTDAAITPLLDVLAFHGVKATFFVRTENVHYNPNLLRAIAAEGHEIACHTHRHFALANDETGNGRRFTELSSTQVAALRGDLAQSYDTLLSVVGDLWVNGTPALGLLFRPPTLAVSRNGLETVLDSGFTWSVSGSWSSQDYKAVSAESLARNLAAKTVPGAVLVMHMSDSSVYTAKALDLYLSQMELATGSRRVTFGRLSDYLPGAR